MTTSGVVKLLFLSLNDPNSHPCLSLSCKGTQVTSRSSLHIDRCILLCISQYIVIFTVIFIVAAYACFSLIYSSKLSTPVLQMNHMERAAKAAEEPPTNGASGNGPHPDFGMAVHGRDEGLRSAQPSAAGSLEEDLPAETFEAQIHSSCGDSKQPSVDILKGGSDSHHENLGHLMMSGEPVALSVSEIGKPIAPAEGIGDQDGLKDEALPEAFPEDLGPFVGALEAELLLDDVDAFDFGDEFILDDGSRILVERTMGNAVHLADILLRRLTPAGCGIVLDERRLGRSPETVKDLLAAVALAHQLSNSMIPDIAFLRLFSNASLAISLGAQGRGDGPSLPPGRLMQESANDAKETSICELIEYSSGRPWYSSIASSAEELARLLCEDVVACLKDMIGLLGNDAWFIGCG